MYIQYCLPLTNGLIKKSENCKFVDRNNYIEACTPIYINYNILKSIYDNTKLEDIYEIFTHIPISEKYKFINGSYKYLRKITTIDDINI
jgi:2-C-methyl-D-erythritol 4-phosphate cytidylyltransferase